MTEGGVELSFSREGRFMHLESRQTVDAPLERVFPFFADPRNLGRITPPWVHFEMLDEPPPEMEVGARLNYRVRIRGLPVRWQSLITVWDPPHRFTDVQTRGPYRDWIHEHRFERSGERTIVLDSVRYRVLFGRLVEPILVRPDVRKIFLHRAEAIPNLIESGPAS